MNDKVVTNSNVDQQSEQHRTMVLVIYGLFAIGIFVGGISTLLGVILAYLKRKEMTGTIYHGHLNSLIISFWIVFFGTIIGLLLIGVRGIGYIVLVIVALVYAIRIIKGFVKAIDRKPIK